VEPPGLFRGRGEHPKMGRIKRRIYPKDIVINIGKGVPIPEHPYPDQHWKMVHACSESSSCLTAVMCRFNSTLVNRSALAHFPWRPLLSHACQQLADCCAPADPARQHRDMAGILARPHHPLQLQVRVAGGQQQLQIRERPGWCCDSAHQHDSCTQ
jgi:Eukaryotic DNA topoisomerase I, DNA binding fragment